jgi:alkanesulfonate monooxygenase SsuD/methylene tetrahydromethanopterin reductase-like flavin-dependent oxidoreductase (luciferase family)
MKFAHFSHVWNKPGMTAAQRYEQLWRELATCDELGFDFGFTVEHHFNPNESWMPSPSIYCTGAAARTRKMRHGPMGLSSRFTTLCESPRMPRSWTTY